MLSILKLSSSTVAFSLDLIILLSTLFFKIRQYVPFIMQETMFNIGAELYVRFMYFYILIFTFKISKGASQSYSRTVSSITIISSYLHVRRESSCGLLMSFKN
jgi:hypothetical protein